MKNLTERQKLILTLVIHEYTHSAEPAGSKRLVRKYGLDFSSATVRSELATLTDMGFLRQPHTSAGRIPTERGYRYFVSSLLRTRELPEEKRRMIEHQFFQAQQERGVDGWMKLAAAILAAQSGAASLVSAPLPVRLGLKYLALIGISDRQMLMALVLLGNQMQQRFVQLPERASQTQLNTIANEINDRFQGWTTRDIRDAILKTQDVDPIKNAVLRNLLTALTEISEMKAGEVFTDGISNVLAEPEFAESEEARKALKLLEEKPALQNFLSRTTMDQKVGGVQVLIGGEGTLRDMQNCSLVLARYGSQETLTGTIGVLGPIRMRYSRNIPTVRFIATILSDIVSDAVIELK